MQVRQAVIAEAKRRVADAEDEAFKAAVLADVARVLAELKAGRNAELRDWRAEPDQWQVSHAK